MLERSRSTWRARRRGLPRLVGIGVGAVLAGLFADAAAHSGLLGGHAGAIAGFAATEHLAHLAVFIGMVLVLAGIVADGLGASSRSPRQEGDPRDAVR